MRYVLHFKYHIIWIVYAFWGNVSLLNTILSKISDSQVTGAKPTRFSRTIVPVGSVFPCKVTSCWMLVRLLVCVTSRCIPLTQEMSRSGLQSIGRLVGYDNNLNLVYVLLQRSHFYFCMALWNSGACIRKELPSPLSIGELNMLHTFFATVQAILGFTTAK